MPNYPNKTSEKSGQRNSSAALKKIKRNVYWQAGLALVTILLTVVIVFAMSAAWYTNIVQASGLVFEAESWGFEGTIQVNSDPIKAAPGDEGQIHMEVANENENVVAVSVNISKARMTKTEMQKRIYFYVDTQMIRNGETMDRVYLNNQDSYTYTIFGKGNLTLTEQLHNDVPLKWQWVYDVLGYYVLGQWNEETKKVDPIEYLRPIEYIYDNATTTFETAEDGTLTKELKTVDGKTTAAEFLVNLSKTDGYSGTINPDHKTEDGHYPVEVDEDGYGVYAYLCNFAEIEMATQFDTQLGMAAAQGAATETYQAQLSISAQQNDENVVTVNTLSALNEAMTMGEGVVVRLTSDMVITDENRIVINEDTRAVLDLNGHEIKTEGTQTVIDAKPGSYLMVRNGILTGTEGTGVGVNTTGAEVILNEVTMRDFEDCVYMNDSGNQLDSRVRLVGCDLSGASSSVYIVGNGGVSEQMTQLIVEKSTLKSDMICIWGNGTVGPNGKWGTDIQILDSTLISNENVKGAAIYHPQPQSDLTIVNSSLSGYTGVALKGGNVKVDGSVIYGWGEKQAGAFAQSGFTDTGDAIYVETNYGYEVVIDVTGNTTLKSTYGYGLQVYEPDADCVSVKLHSCTFMEPVRGEYEKYVAEGSVLNENLVTIL